MTEPKPLSSFKVMTFDVVGTLIDFETGMLDYLRKSGAARAAINDVTILDAYRAARGANKTLRFPDDLERCYGELVRNVGLEGGVSLAKGFRDSAEFWPAFPDSVAALKRLAERHRLVAMTNAQRWALDHFSRTLGNPFWDAVCVDDALTEDIGIAKQLGYTTCWIERRKGTGAGGTIEADAITRPDYHFSTLAELAQFAA
jgi:putative hydrolase of the HAD superfamily